MEQHRVHVTKYKHSVNGRKYYRFDRKPQRLGTYNQKEIKEMKGRAKFSFASTLQELEKNEAKNIFGLIRKGKYEIRRA